MKRLLILKVTLKDGYMDIEGTEIIALTEAEYQALKAVAEHKDYADLPAP